VIPVPCEASRNGYHVAKIPEGEFGQFSKLQEEFAELTDAVAQGNKVMALIEMADLLGAMQGYLEQTYRGTVVLDDLLIMAEATNRAFRSGQRKPKGA